MDVSDLIIVTQRELGQAEWQASIDRQAFSVPLKLTDEAWIAAGKPATFGGTSIVLRLAPLDASSLPRPPGEPYRHAIAVNGRGDLRSSAAGLAAALAYASAAGGMGYVPHTGQKMPLTGLRALLDAMLSAITDLRSGGPVAAPGGATDSTVVHARRAQ